MAGRRLLSLDDHIILLERFDETEQDNKDRVFERLGPMCQFDPATECVIFTGAWEENGQAKYRVGSRVYCLSRVAAWIYFEGFTLWGNNRAVRTCDQPACCNPDHLVVVGNQAEALARQLAEGRLGDQAHRLNRAKAREIRRRAIAGEHPDLLAREFGVRPAAIRAVILGETWPE